MYDYINSSDIKLEDMIFVFGSNLAGRHGAGAAKYALKKRGAIYGIGEGPMRESYALPTMDRNIQPLYLSQIQKHVARFIQFAETRDNLLFQVTQVGCGLGGRTKWDIAPLFKTAPNNCYFDTAWEEVLGENHRYWGTF